ncbi:MAG: nitroreductase family protein [Bacteroidales bacterium]|jgi:nitroreductase/Na+-translocating ferredoxin:NAD+ oxidoreductase RnfG subunit|nr:nitroreductase family protein [Bacteroidales bacterium]
MKGLNKISKIFILLFALAIIIVTSNKFLGNKIKDSKEDSLINNEFQKINSLNYFFKTNFDNFFIANHDTISDKYTLLDKENHFISYLLFTSPYCSEIIGFGGEIPMAICLDNEEKITKIILMDNSETPSFINRLNSLNFFDNWTGLNAEQVINKQVDAVSGATFSSTAIIESIKLRLENYTDKLSSIKTHKVLNIVGMIASFLVLFFAILLFLIDKHPKIIRIILLFASVGILGFWQGNFLSIALLHNWLINGMSINAQIFLFVTLFISILLPIITNKSFYCSYLCPFGAAQELIGQVTKKKFDLKGNFVQYLKYIKYIFLFIIFLFIILSVDFALENFEPFSAFKFQYASLGVLIFAVVLLFISIFIKRPWCRFLCPTGALFSLLKGRHLKLNFQIKNIFHIISGLLAICVVILIILLFKNTQNNKETTAQQIQQFSNSAIDVIFERKSVREYTTQTINKDSLEILVKAGMAAPSARNLQPWKFIVIQDKNTLKNIGEKLPNASMTKNATAAIIVCGDIKKAYVEIDSAYWVQDCSACTENILLAAEAMNLGAVWTAVYPYPDRLKPLREILNIPENLIPLNVIPIGYPEKIEKPKNKWNPENVKWEKF